MVTYKGYELDILVDDDTLTKKGFTSKEIKEILKNMQQFIVNFGLPKQGDMFCLTVDTEFFEVYYIAVVIYSKHITIWLKHETYL